MMEIALGLVACAVFAGLAAVAVTAALKSARVDDVIGEVFSPWIQDSFGPSKAQDPHDPRLSDDQPRAAKRAGPETIAGKRPAPARA